MIELEHYLTVAALLFVIGIFGIFLNRKNIIILLMSVELMLLAVNINLVAFSSFKLYSDWRFSLSVSWGAKANLASTSCQIFLIGNDYYWMASPLGTQP